MHELPEAERILVLAPHPDDEIFGCGGALALLRQRAADVRVVVVTDGALGGVSGHSPLAQRRAEESVQAAQVLNLSAPTFWGLADRSLAEDATLEARILQALAEFAPQLLLLPAPTEIHPDHQALARAGVAALRRCAGECWAGFYEVSFPLPAPNLVLDITAVEALKQQAMACFGTQLQEQPYDLRMAGLNCYRSYHLGAQATSAEAYFLVRQKDLRDGLPDLFDWQLRYRHMMADKNAQIAGKEQQLAALGQQVDTLEQAISLRGQRIGVLEQAVAALTEELGTSNHARDRLQAAYEAMLASTSWRITAPARYVSERVRHARKLARLLPAVVARGGGILPLLRKIARLVAREGLAGIALRVRMLLDQDALGGAHPDVDAAAEPQPWPVPCYIDPKLDQAAIELADAPSLAIHLHLYYTDMLPDMAARLRSVPLPADYYVSIPESADPEAIRARLADALPNAGKIVVEHVPNRGRDIAPLIVQFGARLARYEIVGHFHTKKSPHNPSLQRWCDDILDMLIGPPDSSGGRIAHIISLLLGPASVVYPEGNAGILKDRSGWAANHALARQFLERYSQHSIDDYPLVEFPEGAMFWARGGCLKELLTVPLGYDDFPPEPLPADGTLAHAIERTILIFASKCAARPYRIQRGDSIPDYRHYEPPRDYAPSIVHGDIKVLSYYLPQFHPIPENDLWHGKGFTEWTKVRAANPLFHGHYQQHIPHPDLGYYLLDSPDTLKKQATMMRQAGVHGQVFYHYWFSGKLILQQPARMLLENPDVDMPFCFCWANENWTRRWDGNEQEVLLRQDYSAADARAFIRYLIPYFRDPRHLRVGERPLLFVYRPTSLPADGQYIEIWREECEAAGIAQPYTVAVLTRGAHDPAQFGMDAGVERVLHDWTAGAVPDIRSGLRPYRPLNGSVLSYDKMAEHYIRQPASRNFTHFRSLVPNWDNTARYGSGAYVVHGGTPQKFQAWLEHAVAETQRSLPADRRFVLVNAWNEWAEGAHLEPDTRHGYAYLNAIGRALSGIRYGAERDADLPVAGLSLHLAVPDFILDQIESDGDLGRRFKQCLAHSVALREVRAVTSNAASALGDAIPGIVAGAREEADFVLEIRRLSLFGPAAIGQMLRMACATPASVVIANAYDDRPLLVQPTGNGSVHAHEAYAAPLLLVPRSVAGHGFKNVRMAAGAASFAPPPASRDGNGRPQVTTIIRYHKSSDPRLLAKALYCLAAMQDCRVIPLLALQDLDADQLAAVRRLLDEVPFADGVVPLVHEYRSAGGKGDLRAKMLNESLKQVATRYAAFLDYDDLLMPHAYAWLLERLRRTGKAVSFGRVYSTTCDTTTGLLIERKRVYEYGYGYEDFLQLNHAPIHSFMLDLQQLDLGGLEYHEDQRYLEDYLLTLQLFTADNADWESLAENHYLGDYIHSVDRAQTLAVVDEVARQAILESPEYRICEERIRKIKAARRAGGEAETA